MGKERIDIVMTQRGLAPSREKAKLLVMAGEVFIGSERVAKPDFKIAPDTPITVRTNTIPYVSYGGVKLEAALLQSGTIATGKTAVDVGASTGGFIDCLLQHGAVKVYAVDVGTGQLHAKLRGDPRVVIREGMNARYMTIESIGEFVDLATIDVSFISLKKVLPSVIPLVKPGGRIISLVKPQFEVGRYEVGKAGIVKDDAKIERVLDEIRVFGQDLSLRIASTVEAPREKTKKNREYFILWDA
jgi:23S rRNA (cytidine1920-2'-O)/16S rRNA (cytidine1409-2'-O)-methyltransferase